MRKNLLSVFSIIFLTSFSAVTAQSSDQDKLKKELLLYADNFAAPGAEGAAVQSSAGWFTSARSLDKWQVEVSVHGNALFIPKSKQNKLISNADFAKQHPGESSILSIQGASNALLPTVFGGETDEKFIINFPGLDPIDAIDGLDKKVLVHPYPQVTVGLPYGTEFAARFLPSIVINDVGFSTYGFGLKHNLTQYYERRFNPEDFQIAAVLTYSNFKVDYAFTPLDLAPLGELNRIDVNADLWLGQIIASKLYETFEVFGAAGVTNSNFDYSFGGNGPIQVALNGELSALESTETKFKADLGFNYYFDKFKISTMFTAGSLFNANIGLHYRIR